MLDLDTRAFRRRVAAEIMMSRLGLEPETGPTAPSMRYQ